MSPTSIGRVAAMLRIFGSVSNLPLLTIGDYYIYSYDKMMKQKWRPSMDMVWAFVGVTSWFLQPRGLAWLHCFPYPC